MAQKILNGVHISGTVQLDFMPDHESEGIITLGRYDSNTSRYHNIKSYVSSTEADNYLKFSLHNGTENAIVDVLTLNGNKSANFASKVTAKRILIESDDDNRFIINSNDYTISRIISRGNTGTNLDKGLFSLMSSDGTNNNVEAVRIDSAGNSWFNGGAVSFAGAVNFTAQGIAGSGSINLENDDPFIRLHDNGSGSTTDKKKWDIRAIGATGYESFDIRTVNDANTVFSTKLSIAHGGAATFASDVTATANYTAGNSKIIYKAQRSGGAVSGDWSYDDATTDMSLGTSTAHSFSLKTGDTRALTINSSQNATFAGTITTSDNSSDNYIAATFSDSTYTRIHGYGLYMSRSNSYIRPTTDTGKTLYIGSSDKRWDNVNINATNINFSSDLTVSGSHLVLANGTTYAGSTDYLYIGGSGLDSADAAIYIGNKADGSGYGWRLFYEGSGGGVNNKFIIKAENAGTNVDALGFTQDGNATFAGTVSTGGYLTLNSADNIPRLIFNGSGDDFFFSNTATYFGLYNDTDSRWDIKVDGAGDTTFSGDVNIGADTVGKSFYAYGADTGEGMFWNGDDSHLTIKHNDGDLGLEIYPVAATTPTAPQLKIGRDPGQYWGVYTTDRDAFLIHRQDETSGQMRTNFDQWDSNTTDPSGEWKWRTGDSTGANMTTALTLNKAGNATFEGVIHTTKDGGAVAAISTPRIRLRTDGVIDWGVAYNAGQLTWDSNYAFVNGLSGKGLKFSTNGSTLALTLDTQQFASFATRVGIGVTASTNAMLDVKGPDTDNAVLGRFWSNTGARGSFIIRNGTGVNPTTFIGTAGGSEQLSIGTNNTEAIRIDASSTPNATFAGNVKVKSALIDNASVTSATTTTTVASVSGTTYAAVFFDYVIYKSSNIRAGTVIACSDGTSVSFTETSTTDLGDTSDVTLAVDLSSSNFRLRATTTSSTWNIKSLIRAI